jgi:hypothetical protein
MRPAVASVLALRAALRDDAKEFAWDDGRPPQRAMKTICVLAFWVTTGACALAEVRTWTDDKGRQLVASYAGKEGGNVLLTDAGGRSHAVPLAKLSPADQKWVETAPAPVVSLPVDQTVAIAAARIDALIDRKLKDKGIAPNPPASDETFVRRAYLDIAGRIPTREETVAFLDDSSPRKRSQLIRTLLDSDGYTSHLYNYFAAMLRVRDPDNSALMKAEPYVAWIKHQVRTNRPYNEMVSEMLTATGKLWSNGATGYLLRDSGMTLDNLANSFSVFLGTDVACAQCHDHPFSDWTQKQFYELAAFFGATMTGDYGGGMMEADPVERIMGELMALAEKSGGDVKKVEEARGLLQDIVSANRFVVRDIAENRLRLPMDYAYKDGKPGEPVKPKFIRWSGEDRYNDAYKQNRNNEEKLRQAFAAWLTHPSNPRFSITIANRMWKRAFGAGAAEPVRNVDDPSTAANPELLRHLGQEMIRLKWRLKDFMEIVYNTRAWQREATTAAVGMGEPYHFQGPLLRRMTAEQAWDSFMTLVLGDPDAYTPKTAEQQGRAIDLDVAKATGELVASKLEGFRRVQAALQERGGSLANADMSVTGKKVLEYNGMRLLRAADLEQPAPEGHFLREFGQGNRELIDGSNTEGSQPQVLMLMNGVVQGMLTHPESLVMREVMKNELPKKQVEAAFLTVLNRRPTEAEKKAAFDQLNAFGDGAGTSNISWALLTSLEFMFVQ